MSKNNDPWAVDDGFTQIDWRMRPEDSIDPDEPVLPGSDPDDVLQPNVVSNQVVPPVPVVVPDEEPDSGPEVFEVGDGGTVTLQRDKGWWIAALQNAVGGSPQVYKGKNKNSLLAEVLKAQLNATAKIRDLNRQLKFSKTKPVVLAAPKVPPQGTFAPRELTADEIIDLKLKLEENPALALSEWFQKASGLSLGQLQKLQEDARIGKEARLGQLADEIGTTFCAKHPEYYGCPANFVKLVDYLASLRLGKHADDKNAMSVLYELLEGDFYNEDELEDAYKDLSESGLLISAPRKVVPVTPPVNPAPEPPVVPAAPQPNRIVRTETRPRAAFGIQRSDVTSVPASNETQNAPTADDFENMTDQEVAAALAAVRRHQIQSRRT